MFFDVWEPNVGFERVFTSDGLTYCDGLLGYPLLAHLQAAIDYPSTTLRVTDSRRLEPELSGHWRSVTIKYAGDVGPEADDRGRLTLSRDALTWDHPLGGHTDSWLLDLGASPRLMNWQVRDEKLGGRRQAVIYDLAGDALTVAGKLFPDSLAKQYRPKDFTPAETKPFDVVTFRRAREAAPPPRPAR